MYHLWEYLHHDVEHRSSGPIAHLEKYFQKVFLPLWNSHHLPWHRRVPRWSRFDQNSSSYTKYENHSKENQISHVDRYTFCSFIREREFQSDCCEVPCVLVKYTCTQPEYRPATFDMSAYRLAYSLIKFSGNICFWYSLYLLV